MASPPCLGGPPRRSQITVANGSCKALCDVVCHRIFVERENHLEFCGAKKQFVHAARISSSIYGASGERKASHHIQTAGGLGSSAKKNKLVASLVVNCAPFLARRWHCHRVGIQHLGSCRLGKLCPGMLSDLERTSQISFYLSDGVGEKKQNSWRIKHMQTPK